MRTPSKWMIAAMTLVLAACGEGGDAAEVSAPPPPTTTPESTTSTGSIETTTTTVATTTTTTMAPTTTDPRTIIDVSVAGGAVEGPESIAVALGDTIVIRVSSDVADEVHVHGYDLTADVEAGGSAAIQFDATVPGVFEVELESAGLPLLSLEVGG